MNVGTLNRPTHRSRRILITPPDAPGDLPKRRASIWQFRVKGDLTWYQTGEPYRSRAAARKAIKHLWDEAPINDLHRVN